MAVVPQEHKPTGGKTPTDGHENFRESYGIGFPYPVSLGIQLRIDSSSRLFDHSTAPSCDYPTFDVSFGEFECGY
jgi:hypothetical protein